MIRLIRYMFFGICAVVLQTTLVPSLSIFGQRPDLVVILAVIAGAFEGSRWGSITGFLAGLAVDLYHPPTMGAGAMAGTLAGYLGGRAQVFLDFDLWLNQGVAFALATIAHHALYSIVISLQGEGNLLFLFATTAFGGALYTAFIGAGCLTVVGFVRGRKHVVDRR